MMIANKCTLEQSNIKLINCLANISVLRISVYLLIIAGCFGIIKYWRHHLNYQDALAVKKFNFMSYAMSIGDTLTADTYGKELLDYSNRTPYPRLAAVFLAKILMMQNNLDEAAKKLYFVVNQNNKDPIWHLANLKLAKVLLTQNKLSEAKNILSRGISEKSFSSMYHELQGDLFLANKELTAANLEYNQALKDLPEKAIAPWLDLKILETAVADNISNNN
jgi:predicted negative regulator of RcsB-dependent stress response